jgi:hypothetical protein
LNAAEQKRANDCNGNCRNACKDEGSHDPPQSALQLAAPPTHKPPTETVKFKIQRPSLKKSSLSGVENFNPTNGLKAHGGFALKN